MKRSAGRVIIVNPSVYPGILVYSRPIRLIAIPLMVNMDIDLIHNNSVAIIVP